MTDSSQCSICLELLSDQLKVTSCGHVFHAFCIEQWLEQTKCCPLCKSKQVKKTLTSPEYQPRNVINEYMETLHLLRKASGRGLSSFHHSLLAEAEKKYKIQRHDELVEQKAVVGKSIDKLMGQVSACLEEIKSVSTARAVIENSISAIVREVETVREEQNAISEHKAELEQQKAQLASQVALLRAVESLQKELASIAETGGRGYIRDELSADLQNADACKVVKYQKDWLNKELQNLHARMEAEGAGHAEELESLKQVESKLKREEWHLKDQMADAIADIEAKRARVLELKREKKKLKADEKLALR